MAQNGIYQRKARFWIVGCNVIYQIFDKPIYTVVNSELNMCFHETQIDSTFWTCLCFVSMFCIPSSFSRELQSSKIWDHSESTWSSKLTRTLACRNMTVSPPYLLVTCILSLSFSSFTDSPLHSCSFCST